MVQRQRTLAFPKVFWRKLWGLFGLWFFLFLCFQTVATGAEERPRAALQGNPVKQEEQKKTVGRYTYYGDLAGRINPKGLGFYSGFQYRHVYRYQVPTGLESGYWQTGLKVGLSPAARQAGAHFEWMPWPFLPLRLQYLYYRFSGTSGGLLSFSSTHTPFGDEVRDRRSDEETGWAQRITFQPILQFKVKRLILRNQSELSYFQFSGRGPYFLELEEDTLLKDRDLLFVNRTQLLWSLVAEKAENQLLIGPIYEFTWAREADIRQQKLGIGFYWEPAFAHSTFGRFHLGLKTGYHLEDPNRQGELLIIMAVGFTRSFSGPVR